MIRSTPLRRKTPMKRGGKLPAMSQHKAAMQPAYRKTLREVRLAQFAERGHGYCARCNRECVPEPHHIGGRIGAALLSFVLICRRCHRWIHANGKMARKTGWLK